MPTPRRAASWCWRLAAASGMRGMVGGQMIDMESEGKQLNGAEITRLQALKTGRLIQFAAEAGAILGRAARRAAPRHRRLWPRAGRRLPDL